MRVLDLFSGIGGFSLGLESVGMHTVAFCESDGYARRVLRKHWPEVWLYEDVRTLTAKRLKADGVGPIDLICGGFPCQDISCAGKGAGIEGSRSGLWSEYARLIREIRPRWVIIENVAYLRYRGLDRVLSDLAALGLDAVWITIPASKIGLPHKRERIWILAYSPGISGPMLLSKATDGIARQRLPNSIKPGHRWQRKPRGHQPESVGWSVTPRVRRSCNGVRTRMDSDRIRCLGNAVVPQVVAMIGRAVLNADLTLSNH